jgi:hypothetical protein
MRLSSCDRCQSYLIGCAETCAAALIVNQPIDRYLALAAACTTHPLRDRLPIRMRITSPRISCETADVPSSHRASPAPFVDIR